MYPRYKLCVRFNNSIIYDKYFPSINQAIKVAIGFCSDDIYLSIFDDLTENIFSNAYVLKLCKELRDDKVLF